MCVITEKKLQLNIARLCCRNFLSLVVFWLGGGRAPPGYAYVCTTPTFNNSLHITQYDESNKQLGRKY